MNKPNPKPKPVPYAVLASRTAFTNPYGAMLATWLALFDRRIK